MNDGGDQLIYTSKSVPETIVTSNEAWKLYPQFSIYYYLNFQSVVGKRTELAKKKKGRNFDFFSFLNDLKIRRINLHKLFS